ncbi:hypothetical protein [Yersinia phage vB_YenM_P744]
MIYKGHVVATTTGNDIDGMKLKLFYSHFNLPEPGIIHKKKRKA